MPAVLALGPTAAPTLEQCLRASPDAPGRQAALCALGGLANPTAVPFLIAQLDSDRDHGYEAALALGRLGDPRALDALRRTADDTERNATTRTAAACALLDLGADADAAPLLEAILLAGTPDGQRLAAAHRLPRRSRWALERVLVIDAISRFTGGETFGLDADASWPRLRLGAESFMEALAAAARHRRAANELTTNPDQG